MQNNAIYETLRYKGFANARIGADEAAPKDIDALKELGLGRIYGVKKGKGSIKSGIQKLQDYRIYVHPSCVNTIVELSNYCWAPDKETGQLTTEPIDEYNHIMDALRYATADLSKNTFSF